MINNSLFPKVFSVRQTFVMDLGVVSSQVVTARNGLFLKG